MSRVFIQRTGAPRPRLVFEQLGDDILSGGHGGWEVLDRPGRVAMTAWAGTPGVSWTLPLSLDGFTAGGSVERDVEVLERWGLPADDGEPPTLNVQAAVGRGKATARWVIATIEWGDQIRNDAGERVRQDITLTLLEHVPGQVLKGPAAKSRGKKKKGKGKGKK